jgi:hypothetical protein
MQCKGLCNERIINLLTFTQNRNDTTRLLTLFAQFYLKSTRCALCKLCQFFFRLCSSAGPSKKGTKQMTFPHSQFRNEKKEHNKTEKIKTTCSICFNTAGRINKKSRLCIIKSGEYMALNIGNVML